MCECACMWAIVLVSEGVCIEYERVSEYECLFVGRGECVIMSGWLGYSDQWD